MDLERTLRAPQPIEGLGVHPAAAEDAGVSQRAFDDVEAARQEADVAFRWRALCEREDNRCRLSVEGTLRMRRQPTIDPTDLKIVKPNVHVSMLKRSECRVVSGASARPADAVGRPNGARRE